MSIASDVDAVLPDLVARLTDTPVLALVAPPGSGKTTRVPLALMQATPGTARILLLEPRRVAARAAASHMADLTGSPLGTTVGYQVRFDRRTSKHTRVEVVTEGILTRRLQADPELGGVQVLIFDEFHERNLHTDLGLALALDAQAGLRPDLRIVIMSATLDEAALQRRLPEAVILHAGGAPHPVEVHYRGGGSDPVHDALSAVLRLLDEEPGDALVFLPGVGEIARLEARLRERAPPGLAVLPLHGELDGRAQDRALAPGPDGARRVVLSTNIAESSVTLDGIRLVVDTGLARRPRFDPATGLQRLVLHKISRSSAAQRAGRAGRQRPGVCVRLWSEHEHAARAAQDPPAVADSDLAGLVLELAAWGVTDPATLRFIDPPPAGAVAQARELLQALGALDARGHLSGLGRAIHDLPTHPRLGAMIARATRPSLKALACDLAALLDAGDVVPREAGVGADLVPRLTLLAGGAGAVRPAPLRQARRAAAALRGACGIPRDTPAAAPEHAGEILLAAYPDRIARRRADSTGQYRLRGGRGAALNEDDPLGMADWLVVADVDAGQTRGFIRRAVAIDEASVRSRLGDDIQTVTRVHWDAPAGRVVARRQERLGALVLHSREQAQPPPEAVLEAVLQGVAASELALLPWDDAARQLQARLECLRQWYPDEPWPEMHDGALERDLRDWLSPWLAGVRRATQLERLDLARALRGRVPARLLPHLDRRAPERMKVPSGSRIPLHYAPDAPPVLAVKLQEMFGLHDTPRVCEGRVPVTLHLLSPARRPVQITRDLAGFWATGYAEVRKELRGRYPRHPWPEDPMSATPSARTTSRRR